MHPTPWLAAEDGGVQGSISSAGFFFRALRQRPIHLGTVGQFCLACAMRIARERTPNVPSCAGHPQACDSRRRGRPSAHWTDLMRRAPPRHGPQPTAAHPRLNAQHRGDLLPPGAGLRAGDPVDRVAAMSARLSPSPGIRISFAILANPFSPAATIQALRALHDLRECGTRWAHRPLHLSAGPRLGSALRGNRVASGCAHWIPPRAATQRRMRHFPPVRIGPLSPLASPSRRRRWMTQSNPETGGKLRCAAAAGPPRRRHPRWVCTSDREPVEELWHNAPS